MAQGVAEQMSAIDAGFRRTLIEMARERRDAAAAELGLDGALAAMERFLATIPLRGDEAIGAYWPLGAELDPSPLIETLRQRGHACALPFADQPGTAMIFRLFDDATPLTFDQFDVPAPHVDAPIIEPDIVICPMLAYDRSGARLGYSFGYYNETLADLRARRGAIAVGYAYSRQEVEFMPIEAGEQRMDYIVTESEGFRCTAPAA